MTNEWLTKTKISILLLLAVLGVALLWLALLLWITPNDLPLFTEGVIVIIGSIAGWGACAAAFLAAMANLWEWD